MKKILVFVFSALCFINLFAQQSEKQQLDLLAYEISQDFEKALTQLGAEKHNTSLKFFSPCTMTTYTFSPDSLSADFSDSTNVTLLRRNTNGKYDYLLTTKVNGIIGLTEIDPKTYILMVFEELEKVNPQYAMVKVLKEKGAIFEDNKTTYYGKGYKIFIEEKPNKFEVELTQGNIRIKLLKSNSTYSYEDRNGTLQTIVTGERGFNQSLREIIKVLLKY